MVQKLLIMYLLIQIEEHHQQHLQIKNVNNATIHQKCQVMKAINYLQISQEMICLMEQIIGVKQMVMILQLWKNNLIFMIKKIVQTKDT